MKTTLLLLSLVTMSVQASTLRIACDGNATGAEIYINDKFKGECPIDIQIPGGSTNVTAKKIVNNANQLYKQTIRIGDDVVKRIEINFENIKGQDTQFQLDTASLAQRRYEAEVVEFERSVSACIPTYNSELRKLKQARSSALNEHRAICDAFWGRHVEACGVVDARTADLLNQIDKFNDDISGLEDKGPKNWCESQFQRPNRPK